MRVWEPGEGEFLTHAVGFWANFVPTSRDRSVPGLFASEAVTRRPQPYPWDRPSLTIKDRLDDI